MAERQFPTLSDVARRAGVSLATASRVLGGSRDRVSERLAARVHAAAAALDYVPNAHAKALAQASSTTIGLIVHDVSDPYFTEIARGVLREASALDRLVMICNTYRDPERELQYVVELRAQRVAAILLAGSGYTDPEAEDKLARELQGFTAAGGRAALIGRHTTTIDALQPDNVGGAAAVARHLAELGHREIAVIAGPATLTTIEDRLHGFRTGLAEAGIVLSEHLVRHEDFTRQGGYDATRSLVDGGMTFTAIFALNDPMAVGAMAALRERGLAVPDDVAVAGFDDIPLASDVTPALTTVRIEMAEMGAAAVRLALGDDTAEEVADVGRATLVVRASTAALRSTTARDGDSGVRPSPLTT